MKLINFIRNYKETKGQVKYGVTEGTVSRSELVINNLYVSITGVSMHKST